VDQLARSSKPALLNNRPQIEQRMKGSDTDALVIGGGPAGASVAIRLASLGWRVTLLEQTSFPRQKVCGECLGPASLELLDDFGLGSKVSQLAGPAIRQVAWMARDRTIVAEMPACRGGRHAYGCAIGRDCLDLLLLEHARSQGVDVVQPAKVLRVLGVPGDFDCVYEWRCNGITEARERRTEHHRKAAVVIDAHGSWEHGPECHAAERNHAEDFQPRSSDLLAFKATFDGATLAKGVLPVLCLPGGYGGMVVSDRGRTTIACCIGRATLRQWRAHARGGAAGDVVEGYLRSSCDGVAAALRTAHRQDPWHAVGPLRTGFHQRGASGIPRIGNASAEAHPLIGEGICMALQSAAILAKLFAQRPKDLPAAWIVDVQRAHEAICRKQFSARMRLAQLYARVAMQPSLAAAAGILMTSWPRALTTGALLAGKARRGELELNLRPAVA
jgi:2-polyprenyl-6-methoxyphenol hydroxylase-like FAD-dependent oxidoreductase